MDVIHNGVDVSQYRRDVAAGVAFRARHAIPPREFCIGVVARLEPVKDIPTLLEALAALPPLCDNWRLLIAGDGSQAGMLRQLVNGRAELRRRVSFLGEIREIAQFLNSVDLYVLPSISEGISNSLLEAMATELPVIASAVGGNPEVVVDNRSGMLFPVSNVKALGSKIALLLGSPELRRRLARGAAERVRSEFSLESMVARYEDLYSSVHARRGGRLSPASDRRQIWRETRT